MSEEMSAIDRYRAAWKPNEATIALLETLLKKAEEEDDLATQIYAHNALWEANLPPRNLPIKNWDKVEAA